MALDRDAALKRAEKFLRQGKLDGAIDEYVRLVQDQPRDWASINALGDLYVRAGRPDDAVQQFARVADYLFAEGFLPKAQAVYKKALKVHSTHEPTLLQLTEIAVRQGLLVDARQYLRQLSELRRFRNDARGLAEITVRLGTLEDADPQARLAAATAAEQLGDATLASELLSDPELLLALAKRDFEAGKDTEAIQRVTRVVTQEPQRAPDVMRIARDLVEAGYRDRAFLCVDLLTDAALLEGDLPRAAQYLNEFVQNAPHVPALAKLVEICVDAELNWMMREAQGRLAAALREAGREAEAEAILADLEQGLLAEEMPDEVVDEDFFANLGERVDVGAPEPESAPAPALEPEPEPEPEPEQNPERLTGNHEPALPEIFEIDLSDPLGTIESAPPPALEDVFDEMRAKAARDQMTTDAAAQLESAMAQLRDGREAEAIEGLQAAARTPALRFSAAAQLGGVFMRRGDRAKAIEWMERAAEAPAPSPEEGAGLLYQLAATLEGAGEGARALAILLELDADTPGYRDVRQRITRLTQVQAESSTS